MLAYPMGVWYLRYNKLDASEESYGIMVLLIYHGIVILLQQISSGYGPSATARWAESAGLYVNVIFRERNAT